MCSSTGDKLTSSFYRLPIHHPRRILHPFILIDRQSIIEVEDILMLMMMMMHVRGIPLPLAPRTIPSARLFRHDRGRPDGQNMGDGRREV